MDSAFMLDQGDRNSFIQRLLHTFGCAYICLWLYLPLPSNCLTFFDGLCQNDDNNRPRTFTRNLALTLFQEYKACSFNLLENGGVPGLAFKNNVPYLELKKLDLQRLASLATQSQFYQVARIKTAIFMGCKSGELELGFSNEPQINTEMELRAWFPEDFSRVPHPHCLPPPPKELPPQPTSSRKRPSSSSTSSFRSVSLDSPDNSSLLFNINQMNPPAEILKETTGSIGQVVLQQSTTSTATTHHLHAFRSPAQESEAPAWTQAVLATKSFPPPPPLPPYGYSRQAGAFIEYKYSKAVQVETGSGRQSMLKRVMAFFRRLHGLQLTRTSHSQQMLHANRPTTPKLHHMISERKRREKLNESFQALRSLLPPGIKRDKASLLGCAREYLGSLKAQVSELTRKNEQLEAQVLGGKQATSAAAAGSSDVDGGDDFGGGGASEERLGVQTENVASSMTSSEERRVNLRVSLRGEASLSDVATRILDFLKRVDNVSVSSMEAESTQIEEPVHLHRVIFRLRIEGSDWDESSFREAVRRVVADVAGR